MLKALLGHVWDPATEDHPSNSEEISTTQIRVRLAKTTLQGPISESRWVEIVKKGKDDVNLSIEMAARYTLSQMKEMNLVSPRLFISHC